MANTTKSTTIRFDEKVMNMLRNEAQLEGTTVTNYMRQAILEKLQDSLDYRAAVENIIASNGETLSRKQVLKDLGMD